VFKRLDDKARKKNFKSSSINFEHLIAMINYENGVKIRKRIKIRGRNFTFSLYHFIDKIRYKNF
jgi:hypothetical protein